VVDRLHCLHRAVARRHHPHAGINRDIHALSSLRTQGSPGVNHEDRRYRRTGLIGSKTVAILRRGGHEVVAASPKSGINTITGEGLKEAMAGAQVGDRPRQFASFEDKAVLEFFETSGRNLLPVEAAAGVRHHVAHPSSASTGSPTMAISAPRSCKRN